ncbi:carbohydrate ABC transporter permease [Paenibacillus piri]|uniref:Sugar ABC transporter permease n=1 Tax=Paenibacillus piri TaxID=2547395 RepID=A0A4R5KJU8_9BACL|nr:sugar ABC transporter permease [Paenibacillus piri]TDF95108.1 sugar ABC transporter permease [Paenibacillus piri]
MKTGNVYPMYFLSGVLLIYSGLFFFPSLYGFYLSLTDWNQFSDAVHFIGLDNYRQMIADHALFSGIIVNTIMFALFTTLLKNVIGLALALALNEGLRSKALLRTVFYLPVTLSPLIIGLIFSSVFDANSGILNGFLIRIGLDDWAMAWLADVRFAMGTIISVETWKYAGFNMVIYLAGLQMIPKTYYEAAEIDGASSWKRFVHITFPLVMPAITINLILNLIHGFKIFDLVYVLTGGGPGSATEVLNTAVFREFSAGRFGSATAINVVIFLLITVVTLATLSILSKRSEVEA